MHDFSTISSRSWCEICTFLKEKGFIRLLSLKITGRKCEKSLAIFVTVRGCRIFFQTAQLLVEVIFQQSDFSASRRSDSELVNFMNIVRFVKFQ